MLFCVYLALCVCLFEAHYYLKSFKGTTSFFLGDNGSGKPCQDNFVHSPVSIDFFLLSSFSLGVEPVDRDVVRRPPRQITQGMITRLLAFRVVMSAVCIVMGTFWVFGKEVRTKIEIKISHCFTQDSCSQKDFTVVSLLFA